MEHRFKEESKQKTRRPLLKITGLVVLVVIMVWVRAYYGSLENYKKGEKYLKENQTIRAITFFDRSLHWYTPLNPYVQKSAERLWEVGERAVEEGDTRLALIAFRTIRSGFYGASHFLVPGEDWIEKSESKISAILSLQEQLKGQGLETPETGGSDTDQAADPHPNIFWSVVVEIGFLGWVGSVIGFIFFAWSPKGRAKTTVIPAVVSGCCTLAFFVLWIVGMMKA